MVQAISPVTTARPEAVVTAPVRPAATAASALGSDRVALGALTGQNVRARLEPVLQLMARAGYAKEAAAVRKAHVVLTNGKAFGVEYHAAAYPFNVIAVSRHSFKHLTDKEMASALIHEATHLQQSAVFKLVSGFRSRGGRDFAKDAAEKEAYLKQYQANKALGMRDGEMYWTTVDALRQMGIIVDEP